MPQELTQAMKTAKEIERSLVQNENRLSYVQSEVERLTKTRDELQEQIDKKSADYTLYLSAKDAESKKLRADILIERDQMDKDKAEFQSILMDFKKQKSAFEAIQHGFSSDKARNEAQMNNIREFVIAVQRACSLLGL